MRFNREFFGSFSSKSKPLDAETRALEFGHFPVLFLAERFEVASSSEMKPRPDFTIARTGWRALERDALESST